MPTQSEFERLVRRVAALEERVAALDGGRSAEGSEPRFASDRRPDDASETVRGFLAEGKLLPAIDAYRKEQQVGLREAKERVEELRDQLGY